MRREEILSLRWSQLMDGMLDLGVTKNGIPRIVPLLDGIPETIEQLRQANPTASDNDFIYLNGEGEEIGSFEKVWQNTCGRYTVSRSREWRFAVTSGQVPLPCKRFAKRSSLTEQFVKHFPTCQAVIEYFERESRINKYVGTHRN